jgi:hypothetical protein
LRTTDEESGLDTTADFEKVAAGRVLHRTRLLFVLPLFYHSRTTRRLENGLLSRVSMKRASIQRCAVGRICADALLHAEVAEKYAAAPSAVRLRGVHRRYRGKPANDGSKLMRIAQGCHMHAKATRKIGRFSGPMEDYRT